MSNVTISCLEAAPAFAIYIKNQRKTPVYMKKPTKSHYNQQSPVMRHIVRIHKKQIIQNHAMETRINSPSLIPPGYNLLASVTSDLFWICRKVCV